MFNTLNISRLKLDVTFTVLQGTYNAIRGSRDGNYYMKIILHSW